MKNNNQLQSTLDSLVIIVPAAGVGSRMQASVSKQYLEIAGKTILQHTLDKLDALGPKKIILVVSKEDEMWKSLSLSHRCEVVEGGVLRSDSVLAGLNAAQSEDQDWVMVHDCVRPCVKTSEILNMYEQLKDHPVGGLLGVPVVDTLKKVNEINEVEQTQERAIHWLAQTPQMFRLGLLKKALEESESCSDEASAIEQLGYKPQMVASSKHNIKITTADDLALAEFLLQRENL